MALAAAASACAVAEDTAPAAAVCTVCAAVAALLAAASALVWAAVACALAAVALTAAASRAIDVLHNVFRLFLTADGYFYRAFDCVLLLLGNKRLLVQSLFYRHRIKLPGVWVSVLLGNGYIHPDDQNLAGCQGAESVMLPPEVLSRATV